MLLCGVDIGSILLVGVDCHGQVAGAVLFELRWMIAGKGKQSIEMICCIVLASRSSLQEISSFLAPAVQDSTQQL